MIVGVMYQVMYCTAIKKRRQRQCEQNVYSISRSIYAPTLVPWRRHSEASFVMAELN